MRAEKNSDRSGSTVFIQKANHGGELHDILHLYSDRMEKNIRHCFLKFIPNEFSYGKTQTPHGFFW